MHQSTETPTEPASPSSFWRTGHWLASTSGAAVRRGAAAIRHCGGAVANLVFPPSCQLCGRDMAVPGEVSVCAACRSQVKNRRPLCGACAMPLPTQAAAPRDSCPACCNQRFRFSSVQAVGLYDGLLREAVLRMKRAHEEALTLTMGRLLAETLRFPPSDQPDGPPVRPDLLVPVPMHWTRRISRGINPPDVLAEVISEKLRIPAALDLLRNRRKTSKQGTLLPDQRRRNVREAFSVSTGYDIRDTSVLLIDDVMTTGATGDELSKMLRRAGAQRVSVAVLARGTG